MIKWTGMGQIRLLPDYDVVRRSVAIAVNDEGTFDVTYTETAVEPNTGSASMVHQNQEQIDAVMITSWFKAGECT